MKKYLALTCMVVSACCLVSCVSDTTKLRLGMTKDEVIGVMGKPDSVSAEGHIEFLHYMLEENAGSVSSPNIVAPSIGVVGHAAPGGYINTPTNIENSGAAFQPKPIFPQTILRKESYYVRLVDGIVESYGYGRPGPQVGYAQSAHVVRNLPAPSNQPVAGKGPGSYDEENHSSDITFRESQARSPASATIVSHQDNASAMDMKIKTIDVATAASGTHVELKIRVSYALTGVKEANVDLGSRFSANSYFIAGRQLISPGAGELEFSVPMTMAAWTDKPWTFGAFLRRPGDGSIIMQDIADAHATATKP